MGKMRLRVSGGLKMQDLDKELSRIYDFDIDKF